MKRLFLSVLLTILTSCVSMPGGLDINKHRYNDLVHNYNNKELLRNLIRSRYIEPLLFLKLGSVTSSVSTTTTASAGLGIAAVLEGMLGGEVSVSDKPTITFTPLQGSEFVQYLLSPISYDTLILLYHSGWSAERIFKICVQRINKLTNAKQASGPTPINAPEDTDFQEFVSILRAGQISNNINLTYIKNRKDKSDIAFVISKSKNTDKFKKLLGLDNKSVYTIGSQTVDDIHIETRSLLGVFFYLSQTVDVPNKHKDRGLVTITKTSKGDVFNWSQFIKVMNIRTSETEPSDLLRIEYRKHWFYIEEDDLMSKASFMMLSQLFALQAKGAQINKPVLTIPINN